MVSQTCLPTVNTVQMILNAHKVYAHETRLTISFIDFVLEVVKFLVTRAPLPPIIIRGPRIPVEEIYDVQLNGRHFPMLKEASATSSNKHPTKVCKVCYAQGKSITSGLPLRVSMFVVIAHHSQDFMLNTRTNTVSKFTIRNWTFVHPITRIDIACLCADLNVYFIYSWMMWTCFW